MRWNVNAAASRRDDVDGDEPQNGGRKTEDGQDRHATARPMLDFERIAGAHGKVERIDRERAQEQRQRLENGPSPQVNSFS